jgi:hypothetical protein
MDKEIIYTCECGMKFYSTDPVTTTCPRCGRDMRDEYYLSIIGRRDKVIRKLHTQLSKIRFHIKELISI